jgi:hypothetical protein
MPRKKQGLSEAAFRVAKKAGLTRAKSAKTAKLDAATRRTVEMTTPKKGAKSRNVFVSLSSKKLREVRRDGLDIVPTKAKSGMFVRVPKDAKRVRVTTKKGEVEVRFTQKGKRVRRVDTPMRAADWSKADSRAFANKGRKKSEKLRKITVAVAGYDSTNYYSPSVFASYVTRDFGPSVRRFKKTQKNNFAVRRVYVSKPKPKRSGRRV